MHLKTMLNFGAAIIVITTFCWPLAAQEKIDPSPIVGSWQWDRNGLDGKVHCELGIHEDEGKWVGTYKDDDDVQATVGDVAIEDGVVSFKLTIDDEGKTTVVSFSGKLKDNQITGKMVDSHDKEREWKAKRFMSLANAAGKWQLEFTTPDGTTRNPEFELKDKDGKSAVSFVVEESGAGKAKVRNTDFQDGVLTFDVSLDFQGQELLLQYELEIKGDELEGTMHFEFAEIPEQNGDVEVFGKRIK